MNDKKYISITEASKILEIKAHVIRYWDSKFDGLSTRLSQKGQRFFSKDNIRKLKELKLTLYRNGKFNYPLDLANNIITKNLNKNDLYYNKSGENHDTQTKKIDITKLIEIRDRLKELINP